MLYIDADNVYDLVDYAQVFELNALRVACVGFVIRRSLNLPSRSGGSSADSVNAECDENDERRKALLSTLEDKEKVLYATDIAKVSLTDG